MIGFGEAGGALAPLLSVRPAVYDGAVHDPCRRYAKIEHARDLGFALAPDNRSAVAGAEAILSLVTADQATAAASETARNIAEGGL